MPVFSKLGIGGKPKFGVQTWLFNGAVHHCPDGRAVENTPATAAKFSCFSSGNPFCYGIFQEQGEFGVKLTYSFPLGPSLHIFCSLP